VILKKGFLIVFEGIDGSGKTTQARMLYDTLCKRHFDVILSKEPTDSIYGQKIKELAQSERAFTSPEDEYKLFINDRKFHVETLIRPALNEKKIVILDRYYFSTIAYQGALGLDPEEIRSENALFAPEPDLIFIINIQPGRGLNRIRDGRNEAPNLFEQEESLRKVKEIFDSMKDSYIVRIDGEKSIADIHRDVLEITVKFIRHSLVDEKSPPDLS